MKYCLLAATGADTSDADYDNIAFANIALTFSSSHIISKKQWKATKTLYQKIWKISVLE